MRTRATNITVCLSVISIVLFCTSTLWGQINWERHNELVLDWGAAGEWDEASIYCHTVLKDEDSDTLRMWYSGHPDENNFDIFRIGYAWVRRP